MAPSCRHQVERDAMRRGAPYLLERHLWAQQGRVAHFSCGEWIDDTDTAVFGGAAGEVNRSAASSASGRVRRAAAAAVVAWPRCA